jgi:DNA-binding IclR family transcriptional regulator
VVQLMKQITPLLTTIEPRVQTQTQTVARALDILEVFLIYGPEIGLSEIARLVGLNKATAYRILSTLEGRGYIVRSPDSRKYRLGARTFELGSYFQNQVELRRIALPEMQTMVAETREAAFLCVREGDEALCIERVEAPYGVNIFTLRVGGRQPLHWGGAPRALMAGMADEELIDYAQRTALPANTPFTLTTLDQILDDVRRTQEQGYAFSANDVVLGISALGAPIYGYDNHVVASISLSGLSNRFEGEHLKSLTQTLTATANRLSLSIGGRNGR